MSFFHNKHNKYLASVAMISAIFISVTGSVSAQNSVPTYSAPYSGGTQNAPASSATGGTRNSNYTPNYSAQDSPLYNPAADATTYTPGYTPPAPYVPTKAAATIPDSALLNQNSSNPFNSAPVNPNFGSAGSNAGASSNCGSNSNGSVTTLCNPLQGVNSISDLIFKFMDIVSYLAVIFGVLMLIWIGLQFVMAQGKPEEIKKHREQLLWVVIGIGVILGAKILVSVVINTLQATGTVNSTVLDHASNAIKQL